MLNNMSEDNPLTKEDLISVIEEIFDPIRKQISKMEEAVNFMNERFDEVLKNVNKLEATVDEVKKENQWLKCEVLRLSEALHQHTEELNDIEQYARRDCVEISGVPPEDGEDTDEITTKITTLMDLEIDSSDISTSHRLPAPRSESSTSVRDPALRYPKIIVKFVRRDVKEQFYRGRKHLRNMTTRDIGLSRFSDNKIYVSESLSPRNKELFRDCLKFKRDHNFNYIWTQSGKIHLRKNKHSPARIISSPKTLQDLSRQVTAK